MVEIKTERASYYISTHGKCEYIDIEPGTDTFTFLSPESLKDIVHQAKSQSYLWQNISICNHLTHLSETDHQSHLPELRRKRKTVHQDAPPI